MIQRGLTGGFVCVIDTLTSGCSLPNGARTHISPVVVVRPSPLDDGQ